ncbi:muconolactone Delta-isomerase [Sphingomonas fennica]|uniref:muconolactone Delta-isomerase n=1 Tax=Edaphosphingomonas fennica TaxID=114404 RepID=A0A2T4HLZ0_9SPHN|nr:muconolactone Delta-isomerase family protein [Sphingomonas fennica]PTD16810.1 muconolactone delta-isomerase [Sphingomonas fennica]
MLYLVRMTVSPPYGMPPEEFERLKNQEKEVGIRLQREGVWKHLWRVAGAYANVSIFEVDSPEQLHAAIGSLPFFPFLSVEATPLVAHPSSINPADNPALKEEMA